MSQAVEMIPSSPRQLITTVTRTQTICTKPTTSHLRENPAMEYDPVSIQSHYSPNPAVQRNYTVICHSHRVITIVTAKPAVVRKWIYKIRYLHRHQLRRGRLVVGLGVQWNPERSTHPATLQLCVGKKCLIFQLQYAAFSPTVLRRFISDRSITFLGVWNYRDENMLLYSHHRLQIWRLVDVRHVASDVRGCGRSISLERLAEEILRMKGVEKKEYVGRSDWDQKLLREEQVEYACVDAFLVFVIAKVLRAWKWGQG